MAIKASCTKLPRLDLGDDKDNVSKASAAHRHVPAKRSNQEVGTSTALNASCKRACTAKRCPYNDGDEEEDDSEFPLWVEGRVLLVVQRTHHCGWGLFVTHQLQHQLQGAAPTLDHPPVVFKRFDVVTEYRGTPITAEESKRLTESKNDDYVAALPPGSSGDRYVAIDGLRYDELRRLGLPQTGLGSMANDPLGSGQVANVALHATNVVNGTKQPRRRLFLRAIRDIRAGEELRLDYDGAGGLDRAVAAWQPRSE